MPASEVSLNKCAAPQRRFGLFRDLVELTKPRITGLVLFTAFLGLRLAPVSVASRTLWMTLLGLSAAVGGVNALNMYLERDVDLLMARTQQRPLPQGRLPANLALGLGIILSLLGVVIVLLGSNLLAGILTLLAVVSYALLYTPLKQFTPLALYVGAVPGALPPLIGWVAASGKIELGGVLLFSVMFWWQIPHFLAIALFRNEDYARAGILTLPVIKGVKRTKVEIMLGLVVLLLCSALLIPVQVSALLYPLTAIGLGAMFFYVGLQGLWENNLIAWAKRLFIVSLLYLTALFGALLIPVL